MHDVYRLVKLEAHNFWLFEDVVLDFSKLPLGSVIYVDAMNYDAVDAKSNWTGKSTLMLDAFEWCIYGKYRRLQKVGDVVGKFDKYTMVALTYKNQNHTVELRRYRKHPKFGNRFDIVLDGELMIRERMAENKNLLNDIFHMDIQQYKHGVLFNAEAQNLLELNPAPRLKLLSSIWQLDIYDRAAKAANKKTMALNKKLMHLRSQLGSLDALREEIESNIKEFQDLNKEFDSIKEKKIKELENKIERIKNQMQRIPELDVKKDTLNKKLDKFRRRAKKVESLIIKIESIRIKHGDIKSALAKLESKYSELLGQVKMLSKKRKKMFHNMNKKIGIMCDRCGNIVTQESVSKLIADIDNEIEEIKKQQEDVTDSMQIVKSNSSFVIDGLEKYIQNYQTMDVVSIEMRLRQIYHDMQDRIGEIKRTIDTIKMEIEELKGGSKHIGELQNKIRKLRKQKSPYSKQIASKQKKLDALNDKLSSLETAHKQVVDEITIYNFWANKHTGYAKLRNIILASNIKMFAKEFNKHLQNITEGSISAKWILTANASKIECNLYDSVTMQDKHYMGFSSAQRAKLNCAVDFAMSKVCAPTIGHMNIDERLDHIDTTGLIHIVRYLRGISQEFQKTVFVISHALTTFDPFDAVIKIQRKGNRSSATLEILKGIEDE